MEDTKKKWYSQFFLESLKSSSKGHNVLYCSLLNNNMLKSNIPPEIQGKIQVFLLYRREARTSGFLAHVLFSSPTNDTVTPCTRVSGPGQSQRASHLRGWERTAGLLRAEMPRDQALSLLLREYSEGLEWPVWRPEYSDKLGSHGNVWTQVTQTKAEL